MPERQTLAESVTLTEAAGGAAPKGRRFRARLIAGDIQGSSGYYSSEMLKESGPRVFVEGLPVFMDHPSVTESMDRPERSIRDLAGRLASTAVYEGDGLYADVEVYPHVAPVIEAMANDIGMSIRASGTVEPSTQEGIRGPVVTSLTEAASVDFVTAAGAGGRLVALLESAHHMTGEYLRWATQAHAPVAEAKVSDAAWSGFSQADYDIAQWRKACLVGPAEPSENKGDYKLPVREPDGTLNRNAVHAAASRIGQLDTPPEEKKAAAKKLAGLYRQLKEDPPASLKAMAGMGQQESALAEARTIGAWFESRLHLSFTAMADDMYGCGQLTREERIALSSAIGDALAGFTSAVEKTAPQLYQRDIYDGPPEAAEVSETANVPGGPAETKGAPVSGSTNEQTPPDRGDKTEVTESAREKELAAELAEARKQWEAAKSESAAGLAALEARLAESDAKALRLENERAARAVCEAALAESELHAASAARVTASALRDLPLTEAGTLDGATFGEAVKQAIQDEKTYLATIAEAQGVGAVRGLGESRRDVNESDIEAELAKSFARIGLSEKAASVAAHGRG